MTTKTTNFNFPCSYPLKVMGLNNDAFEPAIRAIFESNTDEKDLPFEKQLSSSGKYVSITITFTATSSEQLDNLYNALNSHELVLMTL